MWQRPILTYLQPIHRCIAQIRNIRAPTVKIGPCKFQITVDVRQFCLEELRVKACQDYVAIEGKHERKMKNGFVVRHFFRKFRLPSGCHPSKIESCLNKDEGVLTITAERNYCDDNRPCETTVPIKSGEEQKCDDAFIQATDTCKTVNPCEVYLKVSTEKKNVTDKQPPDNKNNDEKK